MIIKHNTFDSFYRSPFGSVAAGENVLLRVSIAGNSNPDSVEVRVWDGDERRFAMRFMGMRNDMRLYEVMLIAHDTPALVWYRFEARENGTTYTLGAPSDSTGCGEGIMGSEEGFQITVYDPAYNTPDWMHTGIMYQIMPDRFYHGRGTDQLLHTKDHLGVTIHKDWCEMPIFRPGEKDIEAATDFFGGNLEGIRQKLPYLAGLGVTVIYLNPIFDAHSNHKYDTADYTRIDPMFGSESTFEKLCRDARKRGIHIILDGVFSHVGDDSLYFNRRGTYGEGVGAYQNPQSPYAPWFTFHHWPDDYESWWGFKTLPNTQEMNESYRNFILDGDDAVVKHWVRCGSSGWRLDVADELPMAFLRDLRQQVKGTNPDAVILGEVWEDASHKITYGELRSYVTGDTLDSVMNYPLREVLINFLLNRKTASESAHILRCLCSNYPKPFLYSLMNLLGSHDRPRILNILACHDGEDLERQDRANVHLSQDEKMIGALREHLMLRFIFSMPGIPCIYYGDEAGLEGCADPYCRRTYPWDNEDQNMLSFYRSMTALRREHRVLQTGEVSFLSPSSDVLGVVRTIQDGHDVFGKPARNITAVTLINRSSHSVSCYLPLSDLPGTAYLLTETGEKYLPQNDGFTIKIHSFRGLTLFSRESLNA